MAATYDITSHPLLSDKAKALLNDDASVFDAVVVAAERTLGLHGTSFTGEDAEDAKLANVYQVNYELEQTAESQVHERIERSNRVYYYKSNLDATHPRADKIATRLLEEDESSSGKTTKNYSSAAVSNQTSW